MSKANLNYSLRSLTEPIFFEKNRIYTDSDKLLTSRYFSNIGAFKYPRILIEEKNEELNFLHKIAPGGAIRSYGIEAARLAGVPKKVIKRAKKILENLQEKDLLRSKIN